MKCIKCKAPAVFDIKRHKAAFCEKHLVEHLRGQMLKAVERFGMTAPDERVMVAVSGGKDSLALWDMLLESGYRADGFYLDLGIDEYSHRSLEKIRKFTKNRKTELYVVSLPELYNIGIGEIAKNNLRSACSACGLIKRYCMNLVASCGGYNVVATGHNLDDESSALMGNILHWQTGYLGRQYPSMPEKDGLAKKIKPLCRLTERETAAYCFTRGIDYVLEECPLSEGASSFKYKEILNRLEQQSPGTKDQFYLGFLRKGRQFFRTSEEVRLKGCPQCGQPTARENGNCSFCSQMQLRELDPLLVKEHIRGLF